MESLWERDFGVGLRYDVLEKPWRSRFREIYSGELGVRCAAVESVPNALVPSI